MIIKTANKIAPPVITNNKVLLLELLLLMSLDGGLAFLKISFFFVCFRDLVVRLFPVKMDGPELNTGFFVVTGLFLNALHPNLHKGFAFGFMA